jgi:hypothetical protein
MTPATHAAAAAAAASRCRNVAAATAIAFAVHFFLDAIYHFEAFYELSVPAGWTYQRTMLVLFGGLAALGLPFLVWLWWKNRAVWGFACYAFLMCGLAFEPHPVLRLAWGVILALIWCVLSPAADVRRWVIFGFIGYLPDCLKGSVPLLCRLHDAMHYQSGVDLGDWISLLVRGRWRLNLNSRIYDAYYETGYALEILLEAAILLGSLYWLLRKQSGAAAAGGRRGPAEAALTRIGKASWP